MKLLITTVDSERSKPRDVLVSTAATTSVRRLAPQLLAAHQGMGLTDADLAVPGGSDIALYLGDRRLDPEDTLASAGIRDGSVIGLGMPVPRRDTDYGPERHEMPTPADPSSAAEAELQIIGGPQSGRVHTLRMGTHLIGPAEGSSVRLEGRTVPESGLRLSVRPDGSVIVVLPEGDGQARLSLPEAPANRPRADVAELPPPPVDDTEPDEDQAAAPGAIPVPRGWTPWPPDGELVLGEHLLRITEPTLADAAVVPSPKETGLDFNRPPRILPPLQPETFRLPGPPGTPNRRPIPFLMMIAPLFMGFAMVYFFHSYFYLIFMLLSPVMGLGNWISGRRGGRREFQRAVANYRLRRASLEADVQAKVDTERRVRVSSAPDPATVGLIAAGPGTRLWERRRGDPDNLVLRIGTARQQSLLQIDDASREDNHRTVFWQIPDMPVGVDIVGSRVVGIAGAAEPARSLACWAVAQAAVLHSPRDVRICVLTDGDAADSWDWFRWLPHARSASSAEKAPVILLGNDPETVANRVTELVSMIRTRTQAGQATMRGALLNEPDMLVVLDGARRLRDVPGMIQVLREGPACRIFPLCIDWEERMLPEEASTVVSIARDDLTLRRTGLPDVTGIRPDYVSPEWCEQVARGIAPIHDVTPDATGGLPAQVSLLDLLDLEPPTGGEIAGRWNRRPASTTALIGQGFDRPTAFDLVKDGPHALIAGTTGSGKSELLQTFVASLAAVNRPDELTFVLVDYKGGSAFKDCVRLPHTLGMVTDLDSHLVQRALESLTAELMRREHMLAAAGAKDHTEYRALRRSRPSMPPLPRLVIVIDEFATLAREIPDFIPGLVGIAQRGRSLGLHLVLATQRPAGVVTNDIRANTNLRISLRVTDVTDSQDVLEVPDAASISSSTPGRALVRLGHRSAMSFQTAFVGASRPGPTGTSPAVADPLGSPVGSAGADSAGSPEGAGVPAFDNETTLWAAPVPWQGLGRPAEAPQGDEEAFPDLVEDERPTDLVALVDAIREAAGKTGHVPQASPWLEPLPASLDLDGLPAPAPANGDGRLTPVAWAREDLPMMQAQPPVLLDLNDFGHLYVLGMPRSGRSQTLRTIAAALARANSCADVHFYAADAAGGALAALSALPHTGAVVPRTDIERLSRLLNRLTDELVRRQELLSARSAGTLTELRSMVAPGMRPAHVVLLIDGWDTLNALVADIEDGRMVNQVAMLLREGEAVGIHVIASSERALMGGRIAALNDNKLLLRMNDSGDFAMQGVDRKRIPAVIGPGRGFRTTGGNELQVATLSAGPSGQEQAEALRQIGIEATRRDANVPDFARPFRIETLPSLVSFKDAYARAGAVDRRPLRGMLGLGGDDVSPVWVDFTGVASSFVIAGPPGSGRSTALASLAVSLLRAGTGVVVLAPRESPLRGLAGHHGAAVITSLTPTEQELTAALDSVGGSPAVVLVDDADMLPTPPADPVLREIASSGRDRGLGLAVAGSAEALVSPLSGWIGQVRRTRKGLLLSPQTVSEGDVLGVRLPHNVIRANKVAGRGFTTDPRTNALLTVLIPETVPERDAD